MTIDHNTLLFFDASCLIAAAGSPLGGSSFLLSLCEIGLLQGAVSQFVLWEAECNINSKLDQQALVNFHRIILVTPLTVFGLPSVGEREHYRTIVGEKDDHVVAAAVASGTHFLITLDKRLAERVNAASLGVPALSPGDFVRNILPNHVNYSALER